MASITRLSGGHRMIQFVGRDKKRFTLRLGKVSQRIAESIRVRVEQLNACRLTEHPIDSETARWLSGLDITLLEKLAAVGLVEAVNSSTLGPFVDGYIASRGDVKPATATVYGHTRRCLVEFFGANKPLRKINAGGADDWRLWLITDQKLADNTVRRRCGVAKQFFKSALRKELIAANPFAELTSTVQRNTKRMYFVSREETELVLDACPDAEWRLIFALSRFGGLRCPSEHLALRWSDLDWDRGRILVRSPKTEHLLGKESRAVPMFPELLPYLRDAFDGAAPGSEYVIGKYRDSGCNLRTRLGRIIKHAGLMPWPKLFQNLRSSRETELAEDFPMHVVCAWIGNSQAIALKHYLQVTDDHFQKALQNALQQPAESSRKVSQERSVETQASQFCEPVREFATPRESIEDVSLGNTGLEPVTFRV